MAEGSRGNGYAGNSLWKQMVPCRYFCNGFCRYGEHCNYLHEDPSTAFTSLSRVTTSASNTSTPVDAADHAPQLPNSATVCRYFLMGRCYYGTRCRYDHTSLADRNERYSCNDSTSADLNKHSFSDGKQENAPDSNKVDGAKENSCEGKLEVGDRVVCMISDDDKDGELVLKPQHGVVKWIGHFPDVVKRKQTAENMKVGIEFDNAVCLGSSGYKGKQLFTAKKDHTGLVSFSSVSKESEFLELQKEKEASSCKENKSNEACTYAEAAGGQAEVENPKEIVCPYNITGQCRYGAVMCIFTHGEACDLCGLLCIHPTNEEQNDKHRLECVKSHEAEMELSFAVARSKEKTCGICMDVVLEKKPKGEARFGILPNCTHCFCLACIRKWRSAKSFEHKIVRSCPECRTSSDFVTPSWFWVEEKDEKDKLIVDYKKALSSKPCKYFNEGKGMCPFGGNCFYQHQYPDGTKAELPMPKPRRRHAANGDISILEEMLLMDWIDEREDRDNFYTFDDLEMFLHGITWSETSSDDDDEEEEPDFFLW